MAEWQTGQVILDEYAIEKELGRGGMGRVWLVKSNLTGCWFAVKQTLLKDEKHRKAFLAELQTWIDLPEHPNIVPCRFFRTVADEIVIFADFIEGGSLADWIAKRKLTTLEQILDVAIQFAWGLHAIHEQGLIHQDVKPGNVLMTADGVPMVTDFGLARARLHAADGSFVSPALPPGQQSVLVSSGGMTPAYASPEQKAGKPLSRKTDIWSWGVSVLDMFMGGVSCPHGGHIASEVLEGFAENGQQEEDRPEMPELVAEVLRQCFAHDLAQRWVNLERCALATITGYEDVLGKRYDRKQYHAEPTSKAAVHHDRRHAKATWRDPREWLRDAYAAVGRDSTDAVTFNPPIAYGRKGAGIADLALYEEAEHLFQQAIQTGNRDCAGLLAGLYMDKALLCSSLDDSNGAMKAYDAGIAIGRLMEREGQCDVAGELAMALMNKALALGDMRDLSGAVKLYDQCIEILQRLVAQGARTELASDLALAVMNKAFALRAMGDFAGAMKLCDQSIAIYRRLVEQEGRQELANYLALVLHCKGGSLLHIGDLKDAMRLLDQAIAIYQRLVEQEGRQELADELADVIASKGNTLRAMGDLAGAVRILDQAAAMYRRLVEHEGRRGLTHKLGSVLRDQANVLDDVGDRAAAVKLYDQGIAIYRRMVEQEGRRDLADDLAGMLRNKSNTLRAIGDVTGSVRSCDQSIAIYQRLVEQEGRYDLADELANVLMIKGNILGATGDLAGAMRLLDQAIVMYRRLVEHEGRRELAKQLADAILNKGMKLSATGSMTDAVEVLDEGIAIYQQLVEQEGRKELVGDVAKAELGRTSCLLLQGDMLEKDCNRARKAFAVIVSEAQRTGRSDLAGVVQWAREALGKML